MKILKKKECENFDFLVVVVKIRRGGGTSSPPLPGGFGGGGFPPSLPLPPPQKESGKGGGGGMEKGEGGKPGNGTDLNGLKRVSTGFNRSERIEIYFS